MEVNTIYQTIEWQKTKEGMVQTWKAASKQLDQETFKAEMVKLIETVKSKRPVSLIVDMRRFEFIVVPEIQNWVNVNINLKISKVGCKKVAFVVSHDLFTKVSVEQTIKETKEISFKSEYFDNFSDALKWI
ncbi:MAG: hypothetical protein ABFS35_02590 [Bacteroidota bacterium]